MSSTLSPVTPTECRDELAAALVAVGEQSFFGYVNLAADKEFAAAVATVHQWMTAQVDFRGTQRSGRLQMALPAALAGDMLEAFLGLAEPGTAPELTDMIGEFANMLCGHWLTQRFPTTSFALARPVVGSDEPGPQVPWVAAAAPLLALLNEQPVAVWVECLPEGGA